MLVVVAAMWLTFFGELHRVTPHFAADQVIAVRIQTSRVNLLAEAIAALPGVTGVAAASRLPGERASPALLQTQSGRSARAGIVAAQSSFFGTMGLPILRGRSFDPSEQTARAGVAVVSEALAAELWPNESPIGDTLSVSGRTGTTRAVVVGVCRDALSLGSLEGTGLIPPDISVPIDADSTAETFLLARAATDAHALVRPVGEAARAAGSTMSRAMVVGDENQFVRADSTFMIELLGAFGLVALILAASGVFGVLSQSVAQRTTEFGVRMAVGASPGEVLQMVIVREAKLIAAAVASGALGTVIVTRALFAELVTITGPDLRLWTAIALLCGGSAAAAAILAAHRIVRLDPWTVLRKA
jgi:putative ABC transport system permease protein